MNTKHLIIIFMLIAILAIQCRASVILPRQEDGDVDPNNGEGGEGGEGGGEGGDPNGNSGKGNSEGGNGTGGNGNDGNQENKGGDDKNGTGGNGEEKKPQPTNPAPAPTPAPVQTTQAPVTTSAPVVEQTPVNNVPVAPTAPVTQSITPSSSITATSTPEPVKKEGKFPVMWVSIGVGAFVVVCIIAIIVIKNKNSNKDDDFNFTAQPTTYGSQANYQADEYEQGYAAPISGDYDQYNKQDQYGNQGYDQYGNQGYDQYQQQDQYQYGNQGYDQYQQQDQYANNQGYDQAYPQDATDGQVVPGNQYTIRYDFKPSLNDEIELEPGNVVEIIEVYDDGWAKGRNLTFNTEGVFPVNRITGIDDTKKARYSSLPRPTQ